MLTCRDIIKLRLLHKGSRYIDTRNLEILCTSGLDTSSLNTFRLDATTTSQYFIGLAYFAGPFFTPNIQVSFIDHIPWISDGTIQPPQVHVNTTRPKADKCPGPVVFYNIYQYPNAIQSLSTISQTQLYRGGESEFLLFPPCHSY